MIMLNEGKPIAKKTVNVVDSIMGSGKTTWAIQHINDNPDRHYIYCTPFLTEVERIINSCPEANFVQPLYKGGRKIDNFNLCLMEGRNIVLTHCTFSNANAETFEYLKNGRYTLILDEVLDILINFNEACNDCLKHADIDLLLGEGLISYDRYGRVTWQKESYAESKYGNVERLAKNGNLFYLDKTMLVWQFPPEIFDLFDEIYLLTYMFEGCLLKPYFEYHAIPFRKVGLAKSDDEKLLITEWRDDIEIRKNLKGLISIYDDARYNNFDEWSLSKTWFQKSKQNGRLHNIQLMLYNYFRHITKAQSKDIMWTTYKDYKSSLKGKGYNIVRKITQEEREHMSPTQIAELEDKLRCFVSCNCRSTNNYQERSVLAYVMNMFCNPFIERYFTNKNQADGTCITVDENKIALSCMIQWIWRSRIRDGKPITIWIPSKRMRDLFVGWLNGY